MTAPAPSRVYVANTDSQDLSVLELAADGGLRTLATLPVQRPVQTGRSMLLASSPDSRHLYAGYLSGGNYAVACYALAAGTGMPQLRGTMPLADSMAYLAADRSGRFLLCASYYGDQVTVNEIGADGVVGPVRQAVATAPKAHCIVAAPSNRHVLHTSLGGDVLYQQRFDAGTGLLSPNDPPTFAVAAGSGPRFIAFAPDARWVYVVCELDGAVLVLPFDAAAGTLGPPQQSISALPPGFDGKPWAADIRLAPGGRFLYVSERTSSTLAAFGVDPGSGRLTRIGSFPTVAQPRATAIDPSGRHLLAAGQLSNSVAVHAIDAASGALQRCGEVAVGRNPTWIEILRPLDPVHSRE